MTRHGRGLAVVVTLSVAFALTACGGDDDAQAGSTATRADATTTTLKPAATTTAPPSPAAQAIAAYERAFEIFFKELNPPNAQSPELGKAFGGAALGKVIDAVLKAQQDGVYVVGSMETHPRAVSVTAAKVVLVDCAIERNTTYDRATRAVRDSGSYPVHRRTTVVKHGGTWTVDDFEQLEDSCAP